MGLLRDSVSLRSSARRALRLVASSLVVPRLQRPISDPDPDASELSDDSRLSPADRSYDRVCICTIYIVLRCIFEWSLKIRMKVSSQLETA